MLGRKKKDRPDVPAGPDGAGTLVPGREESLRVLSAFLAAGPTGSSTAGPTVGAPTGPLPGPPIGPLPAGPSAGAPGPSGFVFNIAPMVGPESAQTSMRPAPIPVPGLGATTPDQFQAAFARIESLVSQLSEGSGLSDPWTPAQVQTALGNLETVHSRGDLTEEQYQALKAALESMAPPSSGRR